jgi:hypothetical protein
VRAVRGGKRTGVGRKPGSVWQPKTAEWRTIAAENAAEIVGSKRDPLLFLIDRVFDPSIDIATRVGCAAIATRYLHPTLSATQVSATHTVVKVNQDDLLDRINAMLSRQAVTLEHQDEQDDEPAKADAE